MFSEASTAPFVFHPQLHPTCLALGSLVESDASWLPSTAFFLLHAAADPGQSCKRGAVDPTLPGCGRQTPRVPSPELSTLQVRQGLAPCSSHMLAGDAERFVWELHLSHAGLLQTVIQENTVRAFPERRVIKEAASRREEAKAGPRKGTIGIWRQQG